jgi:autotransporter translocation and assembly factor TamB
MNLFFYVFGHLTTALLIALSCVCALMQSSWAKERLRCALLRAAEDSGCALTIGSLEGEFPSKWVLRDVHLSGMGADTLAIDRLKIRFSPLYLLRREVVVASLHVDHLTYAFTTEQSFLFRPFSPSFSVSVQALRIGQLLLASQENGETLSLVLYGKGRLSRGARSFSADLHAVAPAFSRTFVDVRLRAPERTREAALRVRFRLASTQALLPFFTPALDGDITLDTTLAGPRRTWVSLLAAQPETVSPPLEGETAGVWRHLDLPAFPLLNHTWEFSGAFSLSAEGSVTYHRFTADSPLLEVDGREGRFSFSLPDLRLFAPTLSGSASGKGTWSADALHLEALSDTLQLAGHPFDAARLVCKAERTDALWNGQLDLALAHSRMEIEALSIFTYTPLQTLSIPEITVRAPDALLSAALDVDWTSKEISGSVQAQALHLDRFHFFLPGSHLTGNLGFTAALSGGGTQTLSFQAQVQDLRLYAGAARRLTLSGTLADLWRQPKGALFLEGEGGALKELTLDSFSGATSSEDALWQFTLEAAGAWKAPLRLSTRGEWKYDGSSLFLSVRELTGSVLQRQLSLAKPFTLERTPKRFSLTGSEIHLGDGYCLTAVDLSEHRAKIYSQAKRFPLDLLALALPELSLRGTTSYDAFLDADGEQVQGKLHLLLEYANLLPFGRQEPLQVKGALDAHLNQSKLQMHLNLVATDNQVLDAAATLPIHCSLFPFSLSVDPEKPLAAELIAEGHLEELVDFVNIGSHRTTGLLSGHLLLSKTLRAPSLNGRLEWEQGSYENDYTGTALQDIHGVLDAERHTLTLRSLEGRDAQKGSFCASGTLLLDPARHYPYTVHADLSRLNVVRTDTIQGDVTGPLEISGTTLSAAGNGSFTISSADLEIPDELPLDPPVLPITFINQPSHLDTAPLLPASTFPLDLDLRLTAEDNIRVHGRGLHSEWQGELRLQRTDADVTASGTLTLLKGEYVLAGKAFTLTQGEIAFVDKPSQSANINLTGTLQLPDVTLFVLLSGPLSSPRLTLHSVPQMPTSSLLSRVLFNKDISEITPFQAIQLAQTIVTLSGNAGPDVLEAIRKSLGVDRFNIVSSQYGSDEISVQIGKYLTRGVMVTLSQGTESSHVMVEVELPGGFLFQAETQDQEEGKFSLKWNRNY